MPINPSNPISGLSPQQLQELEQELEGKPPEQAQAPKSEFAADQMDATRSGLQAPKEPGLAVFDAGLHPGSGFPQGTLQTSQGYLVVPNTKGFGFSVYPPDSESINDNPIAITSGSNLIDRSGKVLADFKTSNQVTLPFGLTVTTHSSNPDDPFNGSISFNSGSSKLTWNVVEELQSRVSRDTKIDKETGATLKTDQEALKKAQEEKEKAGFWAGLGAFLGPAIGVLLAPFTWGLSLIGGAVAAGSGIQKGVNASRSVDALRKKVDEEQAQVSGAESRLKTNTENVYELAGTRRIPKEE